MTNNEIPPVGPAVHKDDEALASPFVKCLLRLIRTQDSFGLVPQCRAGSEVANTRGLGAPQRREWLAEQRVSHYNRVSASYLQ
ncbi:hypothetical protein EJ079_10085 [Mesorhizobium sp. M7A.F.Ce.TU.012.03.2.1]|nr:hypothetical protein EJ079_10085 [Mesorhizobium sp. M7A.F.Ce.TU.012.03.2.1]